MLNPSDKELDRLSREAAEHFEPDEMISSWEQIVPRLDREIGVRPNSSFRNFGRGPVAYGIIILALAGISFFFLKQKQAGLRERNPVSVSAEQGSANQDAQKSGAASGNTDAKQSDQRNDASSRSITPGSDTKPEGSHALSPENPAHAETTNAVASNLNRHTTEKGADPGLSPSGSSDKQGRKNNINGRSTATGSTLAILPPLAIQEKPAGKSDVNGNLNKTVQHANESGSSAAQQQHAGASRDVLMAPIAGIVPPTDQNVTVSDASLRNHSKPSVQLSAAAISQSKNTQRVLRMSRALKIGLLYGSDVTSVNSVAPDKLSNSFGLTIGYQFFDHLSINTGAIYTQKYYSANGKDFHHAVNSVPYPIDLEYVTGNCNMWEIPLTLRYDFDRVGNTTFFVNGGASTYFMMHENYVYYFHYSGSPYQTPEKNYNTNEGYLFAVIDFSLGVEQKISKSFSLQVEPFVKIPTKGVGLGKLDLSSYGVNFSLRFAPLLKTSRK